MARDEAYRKAEKKIEEARRSGATNLDLSNPQYKDPKPPQLTELPEALGQLTQLQSLNLSYNQLTTLPEWLGQLTQLRSLDISYNRLTALPRSIGKLTQLKSLDLSGNQLTTLPEALGQLTQLQSLRLSNNNLTPLPESLGQLTQLQSLDLSSNQLTALLESLGQLTQLQSLDLSSNQLTTLPESLGQLTQLQSLNLSINQLTALPEWLGQLTQLQLLELNYNQLTALPESLGNLTKLNDLRLYKNFLTTLPGTIGQLPNLKILWLGSMDSGNPLSHIPLCIQKIRTLEILGVEGCNLKSLPDWINQLTGIQALALKYNQIDDLPLSLSQLEHLTVLDLGNNPLNPELAEAYKQGLPAVKAYLRAKAAAQITLNEAKLILVGEGEVGKSCLLGALRGDKWEEGRPTTHGIEIKPVKVTDLDTKKEITLNGWDFGGQRVYRPTHQLFFSAPAVYLVVWKPREGPQQGFVKEWIQLVKRREPTAKILVVATHGGPQQRQPDIDRQELFDLFGKDTVIDFFFVESKPDEKGERRGIDELKRAIARVASSLPEVGRSVPKSFQDVWQTLQDTGAAYLPLERVLTICREQKMDDELARLFMTISHRLGHLIHYEHDPALRDIVVLKPDWLATAISFVLDDAATRAAHGLVRLSRLSQLWDDPTRAADSRYPATLHPIFLRLMERFDLSYRVADPVSKGDIDPQTLIAQLVPDNRPEKDLAREWIPSPATGDIQQVQICRIVDDKGQSANAEGLFYQLIVRLHKFSLGRVNYNNSVHWQRGLVLDDDYNGIALLEHVGNDVRITVRAPYPERFLAMLTSEVKYLVESFWEGLRCNVMVPCVTPCGRNEPGVGLFEVEKLIDSKRKNRPDFPCPVCNEWQNIDHLLRNAPAAAQPISLDELLIQFVAIKGKLDDVDVNTRRILSQVDKTYTDLLQVFTDEAKEGPRLFSLVPVDRSNFNPKKWVRTKFRLTLWCEHSRKPLPELNEKDKKKGVYEIELDREWFKKAAPYLKLMTGTLSLVLPIATSGIKLNLDDTAYKDIEEQLGFSKSIVDAAIGEGAKVGEFFGAAGTTKLEHGEEIRAQGASLRELHALLKAKDAGFGGLVRVMNKRQEFLWVHPQFEKEY
ncbi:MAG: leucine-rich repeat domain-containing protein [Chloroflexi bacterium]|nr:leucine-rich repeat domain-containing protein [Chloroflexota bacterium]